MLGVEGVGAHASDQGSDGFRLGHDLTLSLPSPGGPGHAILAPRSLALGLSGRRAG
jgi:hypothetical protein